MNRFEQTFAQLKSQGKKALIAFAVAGDPDLGTSRAVFEALLEAGADILEVGVPFSDPMAEGPVILAADERALVSGTTLQDALALCAALRPKTEKPLVLLMYYNMLLAMGIDAFFAACAHSGVDGVIVPDLPFEHQGECLPAADQNGVCLISLVSPTSGERLSRIVPRARGFLYCVSSLGVTGERQSFTADLEAFAKAVNAHGGPPKALGFGVSTSAQAAMAAQYFDGVIVGSALVRQVEEGIADGSCAKRAGAFLSQMRCAMDAPVQGG